MEDRKDPSVADCRREYLQQIAANSERLLDTIETAWAHWYPPEYGAIADTLGILQINLQIALREVHRRLEVEKAA